MSLIRFLTGVMFQKSGVDVLSSPQYVNVKTGTTFNVQESPTGTVEITIPVNGDPSSRYLLEEDFDGGVATTGQVGRNGWGFAGSGGGSQGFLQPLTSGARGEWNIKTSTAAAQKQYLYLPSFSSQATDGVFNGNEAFTLIMRVALTNTGAPVAGTKKYLFGLAEDYSAPSKGIYFSAIDAGTIQAICSDGTPASQDTSIAQSASYHTFMIVSTGSSVTFYIDGSLVATIATHIPTTGMKFFFHVQNGSDSGITKEMHVDYCYCIAYSTR